jgi:hypothetical protein
MSYLNQKQIKSIKSNARRNHANQNRQQQKQQPQQQLESTTVNMIPSIKTATLNTKRIFNYAAMPRLSPTENAMKTDKFHFVKNFNQSTLAQYLKQSILK